MPPAELVADLVRRLLGGNLGNAVPGCTGPVLPGQLWTLKIQLSPGYTGRNAVTIHTRRNAGQTCRRCLQAVRNLLVLPKARWANMRNERLKLAWFWSCSGDVSQAT